MAKDDDEDSAHDWDRFDRAIVLLEALAPCRGCGHAACTCAKLEEGADADNGDRCAACDSPPDECECDGDAELDALVERVDQVDRILADVDVSTVDMRARLDKLEAVPLPTAASAEWPHALGELRRRVEKIEGAGRGRGPMPAAPEPTIVESERERSMRERISGLSRDLEMTRKDARAQEVEIANLRKLCDKFNREIESMSGRLSALDVRTPAAPIVARVERQACTHCGGDGYTAEKSSAICGNCNGSGLAPL